MNLPRLFLLPISLLYGVITYLRNRLYDHGFLHSASFSIPVISIGNLTTGGTGKTPHAEYLIALLKSEYHVASLSRGYGRKTKGFMQVESKTSYHDAGDEPVQIKRKFPEITVAVCEQRKAGIKKIYEMHPETNLLILDDAFQHRAVNPFLSILLIDYADVFSINFPLPSGTLREWKQEMKRADAVVITKLPSILSPIEKRRIESKITLMPHQQLFFSSIVYGEFESFFDKEKSILFNKEYYFSRKYTVLLFTGLAKAEPMADYLRENVGELIHIPFRDHHPFSEEDVLKIRKKFDTIVNKNKIVLCSEKDMLRLQEEPLKKMLEHLPLFYMPIKTVFHQEQEHSFDLYIKEKLKSF